MFGLILLIAIAHSANAIVGYDCGARSMNITTLSLLDIGQCSLPPVHINVTRKYIQLLQLNEYIGTTVIQCKVEIKSSINNCGHFSHNSIVKSGFNEYIMDVSQSGCEEMFRTGTFNLGGNHIIRGLKVNRTSTYSVTLAGYTDAEGNCQGARYSDPYGTWDDVIAVASVKITIRERDANIHLNSNKIQLYSGVVCSLSEKTCMDDEGGNTFWNAIPNDNCKFSQYGILYEGIANKIIDEHDQTVYSLTTKDITFALSIKTREFVCGYQIWRTEHPKLVIFETIVGESFAKPSKVSVNNLDIFTYVNSKFVYVEKHIKSQIKQLYYDVMMQRCRIERETLKNALAIATQAPDQFAYNLMKGPGYMAVTAGEVVHVIKCIPVEVKIQRGEECFAELQVTRGNSTCFLTPRTHILKNKGTRINCNKVLPALYKVGDDWYKITPEVHTASTPITIQPLKEPTWKYVDPASLATNGIYTESDLESLRERIMFPVESSGILNDIAREISGSPINDKEGTLYKIMNEDVMDKIIHNTWGKLWEKFLTFGSASAGVLTIIMCLQAVKMLVGILINGYALHQIYGWSIHLVGAIWDSLAYLLINKQRRAENMQAKHYDVEAAGNNQAEPLRADENIEMQPVPSKPNEQGFFQFTKK